MADEEEGRGRGFTIVDKRGQGEGEAEPEPARSELPPVDFPTFVLSLSTSALVHLGLVADPATGRAARVDLVVARHTIDTLGMLEEKTRGNLEAEEEQLLAHVLADLRMRFVEVGRKGH